MNKYAVLGSPIEHSLSPELHNFLYKRLGIAAFYERFQVGRNDLAEFLHLHNDPDWHGFSLTMPLKEEVIPLCSSIDNEALLAGAVNTLVKDSSGWKGYNTDIIGFRFLLNRFLNEKRAQTDSEKVSILGAGGTARAALVALREMNYEIEVFRRSTFRDEGLFRSNSKARFREWDEIDDAFSASILINCAPIEAFNSQRELPEFDSFLIDSLYNPWPTPLMSKNRGSSFGGKDLLVAQAIPQIELFLNIELDYAEEFRELRSII
ncbi:MAG: shikimate dehydrogenase family protein [Candidatus Nanopelagicaceae bacterium]